MTVQVYKSSDAGAPSLNNTAGSLIALLDACLVNGYGAKTAAGWTKEYVGTNLAAFKQGVGSNGRYLRVNDANTDFARLTGYETMTAISTGTGLFPTAVQLSGGEYVYKFYTGTSGVRDWVVVADEKMVYVWNVTYLDLPTSYPSAWCFGDIPSYKSGDVYNTLLMALGNPGPTSQYPLFSTESSSITSLSTDKYIARKYDQLGAAINVGTHYNYAISTNPIGSGGLPYPHGPDGGMYMSQVWVHEYNSGTPAIRGVLPGFWAPLHNKPFAQGDTWSGSGDLAGRTFIGLRVGSDQGCIALETSDTWYS